jgi:hypothetical protein
MGWSCAARAGRTMRAWSAACVESTKSQNEFVSRGARYFWEVSNVEHGDGAITGAVWRMVGKLPGDGPDTMRCRKAGSFRINPDGTVARAPAWLKAVKVPADFEGEWVGALPGSGGMR